MSDVGANPKMAGAFSARPQVYSSPWSVANGVASIRPGSNFFPQGVYPVPIPPSGVWVGNLNQPAQTFPTTVYIASQATANNHIWRNYVDETAGVVVSWQTIDDSGNAGDTGSQLTRSGTQITAIDYGVGGHAVHTIHGATVITPVTGIGLVVNEVAGSDGLQVFATSGSATDRSLNVAWPGHYNILNCFNDGHGVLGFNGTAQTISWSATGNVVIAAPTGGAEALKATALSGQVCITSVAAGAAAFYSSTTGVIGYAMNAVGANFTMIQNDSTQLWSIAAGPALTSLGTPIFQWSGTGSMTMKAPTAAGVTLTVNNISGSDSIDVNLTSAAGAAWGINMTGSINTDVRGIQITNSNTGTSAALAALVMGVGSSGNQFLIGCTGSTFSGSKFAGGPAGEIAFIWGGNTMPTVIGYGTGGAPKAGMYVGGAGGGIVVPAPTTAVEAIKGTGIANTQAANIVSPNTASQSFGLNVTAGTNSSDWAIAVQNAALTTNLMKLKGDGSFFIGLSPTTSALLGAATGQITAYEPNYAIAAVQNIATESTGSFTATITGMTAATTGTVFWRRTGSKMTLYNTAAITGTSNSTSMTMTGLPAICQPAQNQNTYCFIEDNGAGICALATISGGTVTFNPLKAVGNFVNTGSFTASGTKGLLAVFGLALLLVYDIA